MVTPIEYPTRKIGAILHRRCLLESPEFLGLFVPMIRIAMERDRLHRDLVAKLDQLQASRLRIVRAADEERRRLERNLHDGAQQRLTASLIPFGCSLRGSGVTRTRAAGGRRALRARGRDRRPPRARPRSAPAAPRARRARVGARAGAGRSTIPVELDVRLPSRLPEAIEVAAYYVCAEAATNTIKHAQASQVWLSVVHEDGTLTVVVRDDGVGGACVECGEEQATGLGGLKDRVEALGGVLDVVSPEGAGTLLTATFPLPRVATSVGA